jgi:hypothetical protein
VICSSGAAEGVLVEAGQSGDAEPAVGHVEQPLERERARLVVGEHDHVGALHLDDDREVLGVGERERAGVRAGRVLDRCAEDLERRHALPAHGGHDLVHRGRADDEHAALGRPLQHPAPRPAREQDAGEHGEQGAERELHVGEVRVERGDADQPAGRAHRGRNPRAERVRRVPRRHVEVDQPDPRGERDRQQSARAEVMLGSRDHGEREPDEDGLAGGRDHLSAGATVE